MDDALKKVTEGLQDIADINKRETQKAQKVDALEKRFDGVAATSASAILELQRKIKEQTNLIMAVQAEFQQKIEEQSNSIATLKRDFQQTVQEQSDFITALHERVTTLERESTTLYERVHTLEQDNDKLKRARTATSDRDSTFFTAVKPDSIEEETFRLGKITTEIPPATPLDQFTWQTEGNPIPSTVSSGPTDVPARAESPESPDALHNPTRTTVRRGVSNVGAFGIDHDDSSSDVPLMEVRRRRIERKDAVEAAAADKAQKTAGPLQNRTSPQQNRWSPPLATSHSIPTIQNTLDIMETPDDAGTKKRKRSQRPVDHLTAKTPPAPYMEESRLDNTLSEGSREIQRQDLLSQFQAHKNARAASNESEDEAGDTQSSPGLRAKGGRLRAKVRKSRKARAMEDVGEIW